MDNRARARSSAAFGVALLCFVGAPAFAQSPSVRVGVLNGFGRVTFAFPVATGFHLSQDGDIVTLRFDQPADIPSAGRTRNVLAVRGSPGTAEIQVVPRARIRAISLDGQVIIDVRDPIAQAKVKPGQSHAPLIQPVPAPVSATISAIAAPVAVEPAAVVPNVPQPIEAPAVPVSSVPVAAMPEDVLAVSATPVPLPSGTLGRGAMVPFGRDVGAAAFQRADGNYVIFDERRPIDLRALHDDPAFASATIQLLPAATLLRIDSTPGVQLQLARQPEGWMITAGPVKSSTTPIEPTGENGRMLLKASNPGRVVVVPDAATGENLLVGTIRAGGGGIGVTRHMPEFTLAAT